jgi:ferric iron reductase protein FhuF
VPALTPVAGAEVVAAIRRAAGGNPLLGIGLDCEAGVTAGVPAGVTAGRLCGTSDDGRPDGTATDLAADLTDRVGARLGGCERRVAASLVILGYSARLVGPAVSVLLREDLLLDLRPENVRFGYDPRLGFSMELVRPAAWYGDRAALREGCHRIVVDGHLRPVVEAVRSVTSVAAGLLWGNVASGLAGALRATSTRATSTRATAAGGEAARCHAEGLALLDYGPLRDSGYLSLRSGQLNFLRRSCCLYYRLDGGGMCGDCALLRTR